MLAFKNLAALVIAALVAMGAADGTLLRREAQQGSTDEYDVKVSRSMGSGNSATVVKWHAAYKIGARDQDKQNEVDITISDLAYEGVNFGQFGDKEPPKNANYKAYLDVRNHMTEPQPVEKSSPAKQWLLFDFLELPEKEIKVGDTWKAEVQPPEMMGKAKLSLDAKLVGEDVFQGKPVWVIEVTGTRVPFTGTIKVGLNSADTPQDVKVTGTIDVTSKVLLEKGSCRTLSTTTKTHVEQELELESVPMQMDVDVDSSMVLKG